MLFTGRIYPAVLVTVLFGFLPCANSDPEHYPYMSRSIYWRPYSLDAHTVALFHLDSEPVIDTLELDFDKSKALQADVSAPASAIEPGMAPNAYPMGSPGRLQGGAQLVADGRFGGGLGLDGDDDALVFQTDKMGARTVETWIKLHARPERDAVLFHWSGNERDLWPVTLAIGKDGLFYITIRGERRPAGEARLPVGEWVHLALGWETKEAVLLVNGKQEWRGNLSGQSPPEFAPESRLDTLRVGNSPDQQHGIEATIDEVRVSRTLRAYYRNEMDWTKESREAPSRVGRPWLRDPDDLIFYADFDCTLTPEIHAPDTRFKPFEVKNADTDPWPEEVRQLFPDGVSGYALALGEGSLAPAYQGDGNVLPREGTIAFWMLPLNWDNLGRDNPFDGIAPLTFGLFQIDGEYPEKSDYRRFRPRGWLFEFNLNKDLSETLDKPVQLTPGAWTHLTMTWDSDRLFQVYVNGKKHGMAFDSTSAEWRLLAAMYPGDNTTGRKPVPAWWLESRPDTLRFGQSRYWEQRGLPMPRTAIDDFRIYRRALAMSEIRNLPGLLDPRIELEPLPPIEMNLSYNGVLGWVRADLTPLMDDYASAATAEVTLRQEGREEIVGSGSVSMGEVKRAMVRFEMPPLEFATYTVTAEVKDAEGRAIGGAEQSFTREPPPWWKSQAGLSDRVMPEWTSITADGAAVKVWGRDIHLGPLGLPERIVSADGDVLASPIRLTLRRQGRDVEMQSVEGELPRTTSQGEIRADWRAAAAGEGIELITEGSIEYDGMMWFTVTVRGEEGIPVEVDELTMHIPYTGSSAELIHWYGGGPEGLRDPRVIGIEALPAAEGLLFRSNDRSRVSLAGNLVGSFIPYLMLTGMERGMAWFAENDQGWTQSTNVPAVSIARESDSVILRLNIITSPVKLDAPRVFAFGLHPIPVRPLDPLWRSQGGVIPDTFSANDLKADHPRGAPFHVYPDKGDWDAVRRRFETGKGTVRGDPLMKQRGQEALAAARRRWGDPPPPQTISVPGLYWDMQLANPGGIPRSSEWFPIFWSGSCLWYTPEFVDLLSWAWEQWIEKTDGFIQGAYIDDTWNTAQGEADGPVSYGLPDGRVQPGFQWRGYREFFKRMRQISWDRGVHPKITAHATHTFFIPYLSFASLVLDGEDYSIHPSRQDDFLDHWTLPRLRFMNAAKWGIPTTWLGLRTGGTIGAPVKYPAWEYRQTRAYQAALALHDIEIPFGGRGFGLDEPDVVFVPYWNDGGLAGHEHDGLKVSAWKREGKCLTLLVNTGNERIEAAIRLAPAVMGFVGIEPELLNVEDVDESLLRYFDVDITTVRKPAVLGALEESLGQGGIGDELFSLDERPEDLPVEERRARDPDGKFSWESGVLRCPVRRHDYRLFLFELIDEQR